MSAGGGALHSRARHSTNLKRFQTKQSQANLAEFTKIPIIVLIISTLHFLFAKLVRDRLVALPFFIGSTNEREKEREMGHFRESLWCKLDSAETLFEAECGTLVCAFLPACRYLQMAAIKWTQISTFCNDFASARDVTAFKSSKLALNAFQLR